MAGNDADNRSNQMNPNNDVYWQLRGFDDRPEDWKERIPRRIRTAGATELSSGRLWLEMWRAD